MTNKAIIGETVYRSRFFAQNGSIKGSLSSLCTVFCPLHLA